MARKESAVSQVTVQVRYKQDNVSRGIVAKITKVLLPVEVADVLNIDELRTTKLTSKDVDVSVSEVGPLDSQQCDLVIVIFARDYSPRRLNLDEAAGLISNQVQLELDFRKSGSVQIYLVPAGSSKFNPAPRRSK